MANEIRNAALWPDGELKIEWVRHHMPLLNGLEEEFSKAGDREWIVERQDRW